MRRNDHLAADAVGEGVAEAEVVEWHVKIGDRVEEDQQLADMMTKYNASTVETWLAAIGKIVKPRWDEASFPLLEVAEALHNITRGMPVALACEAAGLTDRVVQKYRNQEPRLEGYFRRARALSAKPLVEKIMGQTAKA